MLRAVGEVRTVRAPLLFPPTLITAQGARHLVYDTLCDPHTHPMKKTTIPVPILKMSKLSLGEIKELAHDTTIGHHNQL